MNRRNCGVAVVSESAYQDAQPDPLPSRSYANIAIRVVVRESPWRYLLNQRGRSVCWDVNNFALMELSALTSSRRTK